MPFELHVTFSGLCFLVRHPTVRAALVLLPDARALRHTKADPSFAVLDDGTIGQSHVGYLRMDLASLVPGTPQGASTREAPAYEVVHRLDREELVLPSLEPDTRDARPYPPLKRLSLPDSDVLAAGAQPFAPLLQGGITEHLLCRTLLRGGELEGITTGKDWLINPSLQQSTKARTEIRGPVAGKIRWTRPMAGTSLDVMLRPLGSDDATAGTRFTLHPVDEGGKQIVALKVGNLCANNPLEWKDDFETLLVDRDLDFKWYFRLLQPPGNAKSFTKALAGAELPYPRRTLDGPQPEGEAGCGGNGTTRAFNLPGSQAPGPKAQATRTARATRKGRSTRR